MCLLILTFILSIFTSGGGVAQEVDSIHEELYTIMEHDPERALELAGLAMNKAESVDYFFGQANSYFIKGYILEDLQNKPVTGLLMYLRADYLLDGIDDEQSAKLHTSILLNAGSILRIHGKAREANDLFDKGIRIALKHGFEEQKMKLLFNKASVLRDLSYTDAAIESLDLVIKEAKQINDYATIDEALNLMGRIFTDTQANSRAKECFLEILSHENAESTLKCYAYYNLGEIHLEEGNTKVALKYFRDADLIAAPLEKPYLKFHINYGLARALLLQGDSQKAHYHASIAGDAFHLITPEYKDLEIFHFISNLHLTEGRTEMANQYMNRYRDVNTKFHKRQEELVRIKSEFQIDLMMTSFYQEIEAERKAELNTVLFTLVITAFIFVILLMYLNRRLQLEGLKRQIVSIRDE